MLEKLLSFTLDMGYGMQSTCPAEYIMLSSPPEYWILASMTWNIYGGGS